MARVVSRHPWTVEIFLSVALLGVLLQMRGPLLQSFEADFLLDASELGLIPTVASIGYLPGAFAGGAFVSRLPVKRALVLALAILFSGLVWIVLAPSYPFLLAGMVVTGLGSGSLQGLSRPLLSHLYPARRGRMFNRQDMVWAIGATVGPGVATLAVLAGDWRIAYGGLALFVLPLVAIVWRVDAPASIENETSVSVRDLRSVLGNGSMLVLAAAILLMSFVESGVFTWLPTYLDEFHTRSTANLVLSGFLAAYVPGRLVFGYAADRVGNVQLVLGAAVCSLPLLFVAFSWAGGLARIGAIVVLGSLVAGMFPTLLAWGTNRTPEYSGPVSAVVLSTSSIGFMIYPAVMGFVAEATDVGTAMRTLLPVMTALTVLMGAVSISGQD